MLDYEKLAQEAKPFEGLTSREEVDKLMVYFMYVRESVMSPEEILHKWCFCLDHDLPVFEAAQIADQVRYELRCQRERPKRILNKFLSCVCILLLVLVAVEVIRVPRRAYLDECGRLVENARKEKEKSLSELERTKAECQVTVAKTVREAKERVDSTEREAKERVAKVERDADTRIKGAESAARQKVAMRISDLVCAAQSGTMEASTALGKIKDQINEEPVQEFPADVEKLMSLAKKIESQSSPSMDTAFDCAEHLKDYLVKNPTLDEAMRLDLMDMMIKCYNSALDGGSGKAGYELFLLYDGKVYCNIAPVFESLGEMGKISLNSDFVVARNIKLSKSALGRSCDIGHYESLSVMVYLADYRREMCFDFADCHRYLLALGRHPRVTPNQLYDIAQRFLTWSTRSYNWNTTLSYNQRKVMLETEAVEHYRMASDRGHVASKRWLIDHGYTLDKK